MATKLFVGNLSFSTTEGDLLDLFKQIGNVQSCELIVDKFTSKSRGFAFVEMGSQEDANKAISELNGKEVDGRALTVNEARPREDRPRRDFGGGGGGGLIFRLEFSVSAGTIPVTVGAGGTGGVWPTLGNKGGNSVFSTLTALGGGGGGTASTGSYDQSGTSGGGGGGSSFRGDNRRLGKTATDASQGKNGGDGDGYPGPFPTETAGLGSGGGGGAGANGTSASYNSGTSTISAGNGGDGFQYAIDGTNKYYAGGGGGTVFLNGATNYVRGIGGQGGGGSGGVSVGGTKPHLGQPGTNGLGGGAGASQVNDNGNNGGSGVVIVRYSV